MSSLRYLAAAILIAASQAAAETTVPPAQGPGPLSKRFPCEAFVKNPEGAWVPTRDVNILLPDGSVITVGAAASFTPGKVTAGPDVGAVIEEACR